MSRDYANMPHLASLIFTHVFPLLSIFPTLIAANRHPLSPSVDGKLTQSAGGYPGLLFASSTHALPPRRRRQMSRGRALPLLLCSLWLLWPAAKSDAQFLGLVSAKIVGWQMLEFPSSPKGHLRLLKVGPIRGIWNGGAASTTRKSTQRRR